MIMVSKCKLLNNNFRRWFTKRRLYILGIETSCDDTGIAIVDAQGNVASNVLKSQQEIHSRYGGIIPPRAQDLHRQQILPAFELCMQEAQMRPEDLDAIAVTTRPGLPMSLLVGLHFAKYLGRKYNKPLVPIHHMEAHALQARMENHIPFPFLCLLISGGHCQLTIVRSPQQFELLGYSLDDAPGEALDKIARRLRLYLIPKYRNWSGGRAIEDAAKEAQQAAYSSDFPMLLAHKRNCNFSFAGLKNSAVRVIKAEEIKEKTAPDRIISNYKGFCLAVLEACTRHLMNRTQRALEYCLLRNVFDTTTTSELSSYPSLVVSGGVANNDHIFLALTKLAEQYSFKAYRPSKKYCSDNGVMIAWNGIERILYDKNNNLRWDYDDIDIKGKEDLGVSLVNDVEQASIKCNWVKFKNT